MEQTVGKYLQVFIVKLVTLIRSLRFLPFCRVFIADPTLGRLGHPTRWFVNQMTYATSIGHDAPSKVHFHMHAK